MQFESMLQLRPVLKGPIYIEVSSFRGKIIYEGQIIMAANMLQRHASFAASRTRFLS